MVTNNAWNSEDPAQVQKGGSGQSSLTVHNLLIGNDINPVTLLPPDSTEGIPLVSQGIGVDPSYSTAVVAGGGTGMTSFNPFEVLASGITDTGAFQSIDNGDINDVLTSNGPGVLPTFQPGGGGGAGAFVWLDTQTADNTSDSIIFDSTFINSSFNNYYFLFDGVVPVSNDQLALQLSTDNGSTWIETDYNGGNAIVITGATGTTGSNTENTYMVISGTGTNSISASTPLFGYGGYVYLNNLTSGSIPRFVCQGTYRRNSGNLIESVGGSAIYTIPITVNAIKIFMVDGSNILQGSTNLYGVKTSS